MDKEVIRNIFGEVGLIYIPLLHRFSQQPPAVSYNPGTEAELETTDFDFPTSQNRRGANQLIWRDQLTKAHIAAITTILRNARWTDGMLMGYQNNNLMVFGACFRGLIEAAADSFESLRNIPLNLGNNFETIQACLNGEVDDRVHLSPELEKVLEHYLYAQKQPKDFEGPAHMQPKPARHYIETLQEAEEGKIVDAYADLCEVTHPAALTVSVFLGLDESEQLVLSTDSDENNINILIQEYKESMPRILRLSLNPAFMTLRIINSLPIEGLHVPQVDYISFEESQEWQSLKEKAGIN